MGLDVILAIDYFDMISFKSLINRYYDQMDAMALTLGSLLNINIGEEMQHEFRRRISITVGHQF